MERLLVYDLNEKSMDKLVRHFVPFKITKSTKEELFEKSDIVVTMTPTTAPHIFIEDLPNREMMICAIGGDSEIKMEFEPKILTIVDHFCDSYEQVSHTGTVHTAINEGIIDIEDLKSLGNLMIGKESLDNSKKIKMFFSTGVALEDLAMAILLYKRIKPTFSY